MAGIEKIASKDLDEVNKINSAVLIGLGTAVVGEVKTGSTFYAGSTVLQTGSGTQTLNPANENVLAGYYAATTLSAVDAQLAAANILSGVNIFGFVGVATVQDIADANAVLADVKAGRTFYSVTGARKTGNLATVAIVADNNAYPAGYHAGDGGGLSAIDVNLAPANILSGVNIFGSVGVATVQEIGAADAVLADVKNGKTFFSVTGGIKTGNMATVAIVAANDNYPAGYHVGNVGGLDAIDADLATANIKSGITIFGKPGSADVRDVSDANALVGEVKTGSTFYAVGGARKTGTGTQTLNPANENVPAGYYAATTLSAVDAQLAAANILSGVNIFGFVGVATVQDIADADALVGQVLNPATFYSVTGARKTGTMPTVALAPGSNAYPAGYHVGAANLTAVDGDLVTANIKNGITIFNIAGDVDVRDVSDADALVGEVKTGSTFYAVGGARKTGNGTQTLNPANEIVAAGYYAATTLSAVDGDLAVGNIKLGVNIFGFVGTLSATLAEDILGSQMCALTEEYSGGNSFYRNDAIGAGADFEFVALTQAYDASSLAVGVGVFDVETNTADTIKVRLFMDGVQVAESAFLLVDPLLYILMATRALSGTVECKLEAHNYGGGESTFYIMGRMNGDIVSAVIAVGSVKIA